jgi:hypothetical protein
LNIIVEAEVLVTVLLQEGKSLVIRKIFKLDKDAWPAEVYGGKELIKKFEIFIATLD